MSEKTELAAAREEINRVDAQMAKLFEQRMAAVRTVAKVKKEAGIPIFDAAREEEVVRRNAALMEDPELRSYYVRFLRGNMELSRAYQHRLCEGMRVAYSGVNGAFGHIAARRIFPDAQAVPYPDFTAAYDAVEQGECDCAVLPIENSYAGDVSQVVDRAFEGTLFITGVYDLEIVQNLLGVPGATVNGIRKAVSHPQALRQSAEYLRAHGIETETETNTAVAAKRVAEAGDRTVAAVASAETAKLYGLEILEKRINESSQNTTRFAVFSRVRNRTVGARFIMFFTVKNEAGSLSRAVGVIGQNGFNLRALKSRPTKGANWEYYFYVEGEGDLSSPQGQAMLASLDRVCPSLKVVGSYRDEPLLKEDSE